MEEVKALHKTRASNRKYNFIYKTTCSVTGRWYIGMHSTDVIEDGYLGSGILLWKSINKHGKENHTREILEFCTNRKSLAAREKEIINSNLLKEDLCMNLTEGGSDFGIAASIRGGKTLIGLKKACKIGGLNCQKIHYTKISKLLKGYAKRQWENNRSKMEIGLMKARTQAATVEAKAKRKATNDERGFMQGEKNSNFGKRNKCVSKDGVTKRIPLDEVENYLANGWTAGIKKLSSCEQQKST